jgi:hypothetical protein
VPFIRVIPVALAAAFSIVSAHAALAAGLTVALSDYPPSSVLMQDGKSFEFPLRVNVTMPGGKPDSNKVDIVATLEKDGKKYPAMTLAYAGHEGEFGGEITLPETGSYTIDVTARDPARGNTGVLKVPVAGLKAADYPNALPQAVIGPAAGAAGGRPGAGRAPAEE